ncbi:hypothetical protein PENSPDRAFT_734619 [Peniophora sp. CONT]|nr:hypothetical protein PENSPDRAFT_734619 [Peniophora sp. CONT]
MSVFAVVVKKHRPPSAPSLDGKPHVHQLPAELLATIFTFTAISLEHADFPHRNITHPWTYLSHVCRRWRSVAISCQELWSITLPRNSEQWTAICLSRAYSTLLHVILGFAYMYREGAYHKASLQVMSQWPRIKTLHANLACELVADQLSIDQESLATLNSLFGTLSVPNHDLEELSLSFQTSTDERHWIPVHLPSSMCPSLQLPQLREVNFGNCVLPYSPVSAPIFPENLRILKLHNSKAWVNVDSMIQCLRATPRLHTLEYVFNIYLDDGDFECDPSHLYQPRCVPLLHLQDLTLSGCWIQNMTIFNYIAAPSRCNVQIGHSRWDPAHIDDEITAEDAVFALVAVGREALKQHFAPASSQGIAFDFVLLSSTEVVARVDDVPSEGTRSLASEIMFDILELDNNAQLQNAIFEMFFSLPVLTATQHLCFSYTTWDQYPACYDQFHNVREISFDDAEDLVAFTLAIEEKGATLFPMLSHVIVDRGHIDHRHQLRELVEALCNAHAATDRFKRLDIPGCYFTTDVLDDMRMKLGPGRLRVSP